MIKKNFSGFRCLDLHFLVKNISVVFIIFLPFQNIIPLYFEENSVLLYKSISYIDEFFTFFLFISFGLFNIIKPHRFKLNINFPFTKYLLILLICSFISVILNKLNFLQGALGIYDLFKNLIIIYVFSSFNWTLNELKRVRNIIIGLGIFLSLCGILTEVIALVYEIGIDKFVSSQKRMGLYRTLSIVGPGNGNYLAMYCLLSFYLLITIKKNIFFIVFFSIIILINIFLTFSRQSWLGIAFGSIFFIDRKVIKYTIGILLIIFVIISIIILTIYSGERYDPDVYYRAFTFLEALKIFIDNPYFGSGPGTFGSPVSVLFESPLYDEWPLFYKQMIERMGSIDSFWSTVAAELGIFGIITLVLFFYSLYVYNLKIKDFFRKNNHVEIANIGKVCSFFVLVLMLMNVFTGFNKAFVVYTFFLLNAIYVSLYRQLKSYEKN